MGQAIAPNARPSLSDPDRPHGTAGGSNVSATSGSLRDDLLPVLGGSEASADPLTTSAGLVPAAMASPGQTGPSPTDPHERVRAKSVQDAIRDIVRGVRALATVRGHVLGPSLTEDGVISIECTVCQRFVVIELGGSHDDMGIEGRVLRPCSKTPYGKVQAVDMREPVTDYV